MYIHICLASAQRLLHFAGLQDFFSYFRAICHMNCLAELIDQATHPFCTVLLFVSHEPGGTSGIYNDFTAFFSDV